LRLVGKETAERDRDESSGGLHERICPPSADQRGSREESKVLSAGAHPDYVTIS